MIDRLLEGRLLTLIVGSVFRLVEILVRTVHITVRGIRLLVQETVTSRIDRWLSGFGKRAIARQARVDRSSIVLVRKDGEYTGDLKYIAEEILRRGGSARITWALHDRARGPFPREFRFVRFGTAAFFRTVAGAGVVIQDGRPLQESGARRGPAQLWLQADGTVVGDAAARDAASSGAAASGEWSARGHARNDLLVGATEEDRAAVRKRVLDRLAVADTGQRFLLYTPAPGSHPGAVSLGGFDPVRVRAALSERFGGTWEILVRPPHTGTAESAMMLAGLPAFCRNAALHPDLQELLAVADAGLATGPGWIADYLLTGRPAFVLTSSAEAPSSAPLIVARSSDGLLRAIAGFDADAHERGVAEHRRASRDDEDGRAASRIVDRIEELTGMTVGTDRTPTGHDERRAL